MGNSECDPIAGVNCTAGRVDQNLSDLESPALNQDQRIDYIFVVPATEGATCVGFIDTMRTGLFAAEPNPFVEQCGSLPDELCWASDPADDDPLDGPRRVYHHCPQPADTQLGVLHWRVTLLPMSSVELCRLE